MDDLDKHAWIMEPEQPTRADTMRRLAIGKNCSLLIEVDPLRPNRIPIMKFLGAETPVNHAKQLVNANLSHWNDETCLKNNLERMLETTLPMKPTEEDTETMDCGICYAYKLEEEEQVSVPEEMCNYEPCGKPYHYLCLVCTLVCCLTLSTIT
jgi:E3 ubiquitin-protein ligase FANCL